MKKGDSAHIKQVVEAEDGSLVIAIEKYGWFGCLAHSFYGILCFLFLAAAVLVVVYGYGFWAIVPGFLCLLFWAEAWLNSNDKLKECIFSELLEETLLKRSKEADPFIMKQLNVHTDTIDCITSKGEAQQYKVEVLQEKLPLYVVKIALSPISQESKLFN